MIEMLSLITTLRIRDINNKVPPDPLLSLMGIPSCSKCPQNTKTGKFQLIISKQFCSGEYIPTVDS